MGTALNMSYSRWPLAGTVVSAPNGIEALAVVPQATASLFFNAFDLAGSCMLNAPSAYTNLLPATLQCWRREHKIAPAGCVIRALLAYHSVKAVVYAQANAVLLARLCFFNESSGAPAWPATPMPAGTTCVTYRDVIKRPRVVVAARRNDAPPPNASATVFAFLCALGVLSCIAATCIAKGRVYDDVAALFEAISMVLVPCYELVRAPLSSVWQTHFAAAWEQHVTPHARTVAARVSGSVEWLCFIGSICLPRWGLWRSVPSDDDDDDF